MHIGFIGLGHMGDGMARCLLKAGHDVTVYNRTRSKAEALGADGAAVAETPAAACASGVVITMLSDDRAVEDVVFGSDGILSALPKDGTHISSSTITVAMSERLALAHRDAGQHYVAAPVFGRPEAAAEAKLFVVAAGEPESIARYQPIFDVIGQKTFTVGEVPAHANLIKLSGNFLIASVIECLGETGALMTKYGVEPRLFYEVMTQSLFAAPIYHTYSELILAGQFSPARFAMPLALKDIRSALAAAEARNVALPVAGLVRDHMIEAIARRGPDFDWAGLAWLAEDRAGVFAGQS